MMLKGFITGLLFLFMGTFLFFEQNVVEARKKIPQWHIKMAQSQGPNTCAVEEIPGTNKKFWTECRYWMHRKICGKKSVIRYECCEGFDRIEGEKGCTGVKPLKNIVETAENLGATKFVQYLRESGLAERLQQGPYTLFAPINSAFESLTPSQIEGLERTRNNPWSATLLYHLVDHRIHSNDIEAENLVTTLDRNQKMRISKYSSGMITVNCAPIVRKDQEATNGVVHLVDTLLEPINTEHLVAALSRDGRFVQLSNLLRESQVASDIIGPGPFTLFSPYDEAFQKYPAARLERIRADPQARKALLQAHIVPHALCIPAVIDVHKLRTMGGDQLTVMCNETGTYVDNTRLTGEFISSNNGVIQIIGDVLVPNRAKSVLELVESSQEVPTFLEIIRLAGLEVALDGAGNLTVFAPSEEAFKDLKESELRHLTRDAASAREMVMYHVAQGRHMTERITDGQRVPCVDGRNSLRLRMYRKGYGVETAMIKSQGIEGQNGVVHIIDRIIRPPTNNIIETLEKDGNFSIMLEALQKVRKSEPELLESGQRSLTLFAPSDEAFRKLGKETLQKVMTDTEYLSQVVKNHLVENMMPSCAFKSKLHYNVQTKQNSLGVEKKHHRLQVGGAHVLKPDLVTRDGIVHYVDRVILPEECKTCHTTITHTSHTYVDITHDNH